MEELESVKETKYVVEIAGKEMEIKFDFLAWADLTEKYGSLENLDKIEKEMMANPFKALPELLYIGLVDKEGIKKETLLKGIMPTEIESFTKVVFGALYASLPKTNKKKVAEKK